MTGRRVARLASAVAVVALTTIASPAGLGAAPDPGAGGAAPPRARITLLEQPAWTALGTDLPMRIGIQGDAAGLTVRAVVHQYVTSRTAFERSLEGERLGSTLGAPYEQPVDALPSAAGGRLFTLPLQDPNLPRDPARLRVPLPSGVTAGVFPVEIELWDGGAGRRIDGFVTHLVAVAPGAEQDAVGERLDVGWIWRLAASPAYEPAGRLSADFLGSATGGRLARLVSLLPDATNLPVTFAPNPETLAAWVDAAATNTTLASSLATIRTAAATHQVIAGPFVPLNVPGLETAGLGGETAVELAQGADTLSQTLGTRVDPRTSLVSPIDGNTLARLRESGVDRVVLDGSALTAPSTAQQFTPARPVLLESDDRRFTAVQVDRRLEALLDGSGTPALRAQHLLAGLAVVALEQPNQRRGVVLDTPGNWNPSADAVNAVIAGLRDHPLLDAVSLDDFFASVPVETDRRDNAVVRQLSPISPVLPAVTARQYRSAHDRLDAFARLAGEDDPTVVRGRRALLVSLTSDWQGARGRRLAAAQLGALEHRVDTFTAGIRAPQARTVTLTSRDAAIPISILNETGRRVRVRVTLASEKLLFPNGSTRVLDLPPRNTTVRFDVEARASGTFPLRIKLTSADGSLPIQETRVTVRSTVVSGVGVFLTISAGVFLAIWWITHWRRTRRSPRRAALAT